MRSHSVRRAVVAALFCSALAASYAVAKYGFVQTKDGATFEGDIVERDGMVVVKDKRGIETRIKRENVVSVEYREDVDFEFNARHAKLAPGDVPGRVELAKFAMGQRRPDLARLVLLEALALDPNDREASALYDAAKGQIELDRRAAEGKPAKRVLPVAAQAATQPMGDPRNDRLRADLLNSEQVNRLRQAEVRQGETTLNFKFENDVERRFTIKQMITLASFRQQSPLERFLMMRDRNEWDMLRDVKILRDPQSLADYRQRIQPVLLSGCAKAGCHNEPSGRSFILHTQGEAEARDYTNFYILSTAKYPLVLSGGHRILGPVVDRTTPERSILLQYALAGTTAQFPHPAVQGYRGIAQGPDDARFRTMLTWIRDTLSPREPRYGFTVGNIGTAPLPGVQPATTQSASTQPSTTQRGASTRPATRP